MSQKQNKGFTQPGTSALAAAVKEEAAAQDQAASQAAEQATEQKVDEAADAGQDSAAGATEGTDNGSAAAVTTEVPAPAPAPTPAPVKEVSVTAATPLTGAVQTKPVAASSGVTVTKPEERVLGVGRTTSQAPAPETNELQERLDRILKDVPAAYYNDITRIRMYCQAMAPTNQLMASAAATEQSALYRSIQNIINRQAQYFQPLFTALLAVFHAERKGALGDRFRNRYMEHVVLSQSDRNAFVSLTHLLAVTADPKSRDLALKQLDIEKALENGLTAEGKLRVLEYFGK